MTAADGSELQARHLTEKGNHWAGVHAAQAYTGLGSIISTTHTDTYIQTQTHRHRQTHRDSGTLIEEARVGKCLFSSVFILT